MQVLWLASWYPDAYEPKNGDFIQRNAHAVAEIIPLVVIHVVQAGSHLKTKAKLEITKMKGIEEWIVYFNYTTTPIIPLNTILYQYAYRSCYKAILRKYAAAFGYPHVVHVHAPIRAGLIARSWCKKKSIPYIVSEHASMYADTATDHFQNRPFWFKRAVKLVLQDAALVANVSQTIATRLKALFQLKQVMVIPNLVNTKKFYYQARVHSDAFTFLHVSSFLPQKNIPGLLSAFQQLMQYHSNWKLIMLGPLTTEIQRLIAEKKLSEYVFCTGEVEHEAVAGFMQHAEALVLFSWQENAPCVIAEALCCGLPVITSNAGGAAEPVHAGNGIVVPPGDEQALTNACIKMMEQYHHYNRTEIAETAAKKFTASVIARQMVDIYAPFSPEKG
ncbi:glycosyltransferase [Hydrotalea sp.]|uniref:glycosyltransferase n=2 Tax=Hydrotalea sp. TaxID=2881279 RepID=UPI00262AD6F9|nr:glycosyltransferase [Hydrotalea sp.]